MGSSVHVRAVAPLLYLFPLRFREALGLSDDARFALFRALDDDGAKSNSGGVLLLIYGGRCFARRYV